MYRRASVWTDQTLYHRMKLPYLDGKIQIPGILAHQMGFDKNLDAEGTCNGKKQNGKYKFQKKQTGCIIVTLIFHMNPIPFP